jgi:hypothetical protein
VYHVALLYPLKLALTSQKSGGHSVGIVRWRTQTAEFVFEINDSAIDENVALC